MKLSAPTVEPANFSQDDLLQLQKLTAQRADELLRQQGGSRGNDLEIWLKAEEDVLLHFLVPAN